MYVNASDTVYIYLGKGGGCYGLNWHLSKPLDFKICDLYVFSGLRVPFRLFLVIFWVLPTLFLKTQFLPHPDRNIIIEDNMNDHSFPLFGRVLFLYLC